jgi:hypothetical protein
MMDHEAVTHCYSNSSNSIQTEAGGKGQPSIQIAPAWNFLYLILHPACFGCQSQREIMLRLCCRFGFFGILSSLPPDLILQIDMLIVGFHKEGFLSSFAW